MSFIDLAKQFVTDMNHILPNEIKSHHLMELLDVENTGANYRLNELMRAGYLEKVNTSTWRKTNLMHEVTPLFRKRRSVYELRAKYGWKEMPQDEYWRRIHVLLPSSFTITQVQDVSKYCNPATIKGFLREMEKLGLVQENILWDSKGMWDKTEAVENTPYPEKDHNTTWCYPKLLDSGLIVASFETEPTSIEAATPEITPNAQELENITSNLHQAMYEDLEHAINNLKMDHKQAIHDLKMAHQVECDRLYEDKWALQDKYNKLLEHVKVLLDSDRVQRESSVNLQMAFEHMDDFLGM